MKGYPLDSLFFVQINRFSLKFDHRLLNGLLTYFFFTLPIILLHVLIVLIKKQMTQLVNCISVEDQPREKLVNKGATSLSNYELLAIILGSGSREESVVELSARVLAAYSNQFSQLSRMSFDELQQFKGIGPAKATTLCALFEISKRKRQEVQKTVLIKGSSDAYKVLCSELIDLNHEEFWVMYLNRAHGILKKERISKGGVSGTVVDTKLILKKGVLLLASSIILIHNHPSGNLKPSEQDKIMTNKIKSACELLEINLIDHIIIAGNSYYSFADESML